MPLRISRILKYSIFLYLLTAFLMLIKSIREKEKTKSLMWSLLFLVPAAGSIIYLCIHYTAHDVISEIIKYLIELYIVAACIMTAESIKAKRKKQALIWGTLFFLPIILVFTLWGSVLSIL